MRFLIFKIFKFCRWAEILKKIWKNNFPEIDFFQIKNLKFKFSKNFLKIRIFKTWKNIFGAKALFLFKKEVCVTSKNFWFLKNVLKQKKWSENSKTHLVSLGASLEAFCCVSPESSTPAGIPPMIGTAPFACSALFSSSSSRIIGSVGACEIWLPDFWSGGLAGVGAAAAEGVLLISFDIIDDDVNWLYCGCCEWSLWVGMPPPLAATAPVAVRCAWTVEFSGIRPFGSAILRVPDVTTVVPDVGCADAVAVELRLKSGGIWAICVVFGAENRRVLQDSEVQKLEFRSLEAQNSESEIQNLDVEIQKNPIQNSRILNPNSFWRLKEILTRLIAGRLQQTDSCLSAGRLCPHLNSSVSCSTHHNRIIGTRGGCIVLWTSSRRSRSSRSGGWRGSSSSMLLGIGCGGKGRSSGDGGASGRRRATRIAGWLKVAND